MLEIDEKARHVFNDGVKKLFLSIKQLDDVIIVDSAMYRANW